MSKDFAAPHPNITLERMSPKTHRVFSRDPDYAQGPVSTQKAEGAIVKGTKGTLDH